jgi:hypothetical protein
MTSQAIEGACAFAWRNYFLLHSGVGEGYGTDLSRYVTKTSRCRRVLRSLANSDGCLFEKAGRTA